MKVWLRTDNGKTVVNMERALYVTIYNEDIVDRKTPYHIKALFGESDRGYFDVTLARFKDYQKAREYIEDLHSDIRKLEKEKNANS